MRYFLGMITGAIGAAAVWLALLLVSLGQSYSIESIQIGEWHRIKDEALAKSPSSRILVVGGSSGLYGVNAAQLSEATGWPVVNYASHAALLLPYHLDRAIQAAERGDVVLLHLEFGLLARNEPNIVSTQYFFEHEPEWLFQRPPVEQLRWVLSADPGHLARRLHTAATGGNKTLKRDLKNYAERTIDPFGSFRGHSAASQKPHMKQAVEALVPLKPFRDARYLRHRLVRAGVPLGEFLEKARKKGVTVISVFPPIMYEEPAAEWERKAIEESFSLWRDHYEQSGLAPAGSPRDVLYPRDAFYDTLKHLNEETMQKHTETVGRLILPLLPERAPTPDGPSAEAPVQHP